MGITEEYFKWGIVIIALILLVIPLIYLELWKKKQEPYTLRQWNTFTTEFRKEGQRQQLRRDAWLVWSQRHNGTWPMESIGLPDTPATKKELDDIERELDKQSIMKYGYLLLPQPPPTSVIIDAEEMFDDLEKGW